MKVCCNCKLDKELSDFNKNSNKPDGLQVICRVCSNKRSALHYQNNKQSYRDSQNKSRQTLKQFLLEYLVEHPCVDCGESNPVVLDFDHVSGTKIRNIGEMAHAGVSLDNLKLEMEKCVVRCSHCHRKKTAKDFNWFRGINNPV